MSELSTIKISELNLTSDLQNEDYLLISRQNSDNNEFKSFATQVSNIVDVILDGHYATQSLVSEISSTLNSKISQLNNSAVLKTNVDQSIDGNKTFIYGLSSQSDINENTNITFRPTTAQTVNKINYYDNSTNVIRSTIQYNKDIKNNNVSGYILSEQVIGNKPSYHTSKIELSTDSTTTADGTQINILADRINIGYDSDSIVNINGQITNNGNPLPTQSSINNLRNDLSDLINLCKNHSITTETWKFNETETGNEVQKLVIVLTDK